jgi:hypothetical protein
MVEFGFSISWAISDDEQRQTFWQPPLEMRLSFWKGSGFISPRLPEKAGLLLKDTVFDEAREVFR